MYKLALVIAAGMTLSACVDLPGVGLGTGVQVYKYVGSRQCESGGTSIEKMMRQLSEGGVPVMNVHCGTDGRMYAAMCGAPDGRIGILEVPEGKVSAAAALGFAPLSSLPGASKTVCPKTP